MKKWTVCVVSVCALAMTVGIPGCKPSQEKLEQQAVQQEMLRQEVEAQAAEILGLQSQGQADAAMEQLEKVLADTKYKAFRPRFFAQKIDLLFAQEKDGEASGLFLKTWEKDPELAQDAAGRIHAFYQAAQDNPSILAWCRQLLGTGKGKALPQGLRGQVLGWQLSAAMALDDSAAASDTIGQLFTGLSPEEAVPHLQAALRTLTGGGKFALASEIVSRLDANRKFEAYQPRFFVLKVDLLLAQDKGEEAGALILKTWEKAPETAQGAFGRMHAYHQGKQDNPAVLAWCRQLLGTGKALPQGLHGQVLGWQLSAAMALDDSAAVTGAVAQLIAGLEPKKAVPLLQAALTAKMNAEKFALVSEIIVCLGKEGAAQAYRDLAVTSNLQNLIAQKAWDKTPEAFEACAAQLEDDVLSALLRQAFTALQKNQQTALLEKVCHNIFLASTSKTGSAGYAARLWVDIGMAADKRVLPERLTALLDARVQAEQAADRLEHYFYEFVEDHGTIKKLSAIGERILKEPVSEDRRNSLTVKLLDGAFIVEDYDLALQMLERGVPDKAKEWHDMSIPKVKAHRALAQDKPLEAIGFFREFMGVLTASDMEEEHDPTTGVAYSKEWILGRNAHRIATLYDSVPDAANAAKARDEAKALFATALTKAEKDADTLKALKAEMKEMGF